jgi:hypothetical protein
LSPRGVGVGAGCAAEAAGWSTGANKTRGAAIKNQLNTEIAACDKKQKEQEHKHAHDASHGVEQPESIYTKWTSKQWALNPCSKASVN